MSIKKILAFVALSSLLIAGCSSKRDAIQQDQFCNVKTVTVSVKNDESGKESMKSMEILQCNDSQFERIFDVKAGMAPTCSEFTFWIKLRGNDVQRKGISCQKPDGSWEIINTYIQ